MKNLLEQAYEFGDCVMLDKKTAPDGFGGFKTEYAEGASFKAAIKFDGSTEAQIAAVQGVKSLYTIITKKAISFDYHDIFMRLEDGKTFRITSDGNDNKTPESAGLDMRSTAAEEWKI